jgi:hypothetical protein
MPGNREKRQGRRFRFWPKFPVDRGNDENAEPTFQNKHGAKNKRRMAKRHEKPMPSNDLITWKDFRNIQYGLKMRKIFRNLPFRFYQYDGQVRNVALSP